MTRETFAAAVPPPAIVDEISAANLEGKISGSSHSAAAARDLVTVIMTNIAPTLSNSRFC